jgi:hypothetical protein
MATPGARVWNCPSLRLNILLYTPNRTLCQIMRTSTPILKEVVKVLYDSITLPQYQKLLIHPLPFVGPLYMMSQPLTPDLAPTYNVSHQHPSV